MECFAFHKRIAKMEHIYELSLCVPPHLGGQYVPLGEVSS